MIRLKVLLLIVSLSSVLFVNCSNFEEIQEINQFSWDLFKIIATEEEPNVIINGLGPQLLLLEVMLGAKGKTYDEIFDTAKHSSHHELLKYYDFLNGNPKMKDFKTRIATFVTSQSKFHDTFLNEMFERNVEFRTTDFSDVKQTNILLNRFYKYINLNDVDNYPRNTKMVLKSTSVLDFQIDCHFVNTASFTLEDKRSKAMNFSKIYDSFDGGFVKNGRGSNIAAWVELPKKYMKNNGISIVFVQPIKSTIHEVIDQIQDLNFKNVPEHNYKMLEIPSLLMTQVISLNPHLIEMGISSMFSEKDANFTGITGTTDQDQIFVNDFKQTTAVNIDCKPVGFNSTIPDDLESLALNTPFLYIVFDVKHQLPLLIGKLSDPELAKPTSGRQTFCKIPEVVNGYMVNDLHNENIYKFRDDVEVYEKTQVWCNPGYDLELINKVQTISCTSNGWVGDIPKCQKMCRLSLLQSHSTNVSCINKNNNTFNCNRSVAPGDRVNIKCKIKYSFDENAKQHFVCKENGEWDGDRTQCKAECGVLVQKGTPNIVGGQESFPNEVPWNTAIYHNDIQICGGTIISELIVLSAAHCFKAEQNKGIAEIVVINYKVAVGKYFRDIKTKENDTQTLQIEKIEIPQRYLGDSMHYEADFAVLTLKDVIIYKNHIAPACLNIEAYHTLEKAGPADGSEGLVSGFGQTGDGNPSPILKKMYLPTISNIDCLKSAPGNYRSYVKLDKICAGSLGEVGVCVGDSGGGLLFKKTNTSIYHIHGVVSNSKSFDGNVKCDFSFYSLFTNVMDYIDLVREEHTKSLDILREMIEKPKQRERET